MLPKQFQKQNISKRNKLLSQLKMYTITYEYELNPFYAQYIKDSYEKLGTIVDVLGVMKLTGYDKDEVEYNFHQLMSIHYKNTKKITSYSIIEITHS